MFARLIVCALSLGLLASILAGCSSPRAVATVNGKNITEEELFRDLKTYHGMGMGRLQWLINYHLVMEELERKKLKVAEKEVEDGIRNERRQSGQNPDDWQREARANGADLDDIRRYFRFELAIQKLVTDGVRVSDDEVKQAYQQNEQSFLRLQFARIVLRTEKEAQQVYKRLSEGAHFAAMVKEYSVDSPEIRDRGGIADPPLPASACRQEYLRALEGIGVQRLEEAIDMATKPFGLDGFFVVIKLAKLEKVKLEEVRDLIRRQMAEMKAARQGRTRDSILIPLIEKASVAVKDRQLMTLEAQYGKSVAGKLGKLGTLPPLPPAKGKAPAEEESESKATSKSKTSGGGKGD